MSKSLKIAFIILGILGIVFLGLTSYALLKGSLFDAVEKHNFIFIKTAINIFSSLAKLNYNGWSLLHEAAKNSDENITEFLIHHGADVNLVNPDKYDYPTISYCGPSYYGQTPLHIAVLYDMTIRRDKKQCDNKEIVKLLLHNGANINARDNSGNTPLHYAVMIKNRKEMVKLLLDNDVEVNARNNAGETPLRRCCDDVEIIKLMVSKGAEY